MNTADVLPPDEPFVRLSHRDEIGGGGVVVFPCLKMWAMGIPFPYLKIWVMGIPSLRDGFWTVRYLDSFWMRRVAVSP